MYITTYEKAQNNNIKIIEDSVTNDKEIDKLDFTLLEQNAKKSQQKDAKGIYFEYDWKFTENGIETRVCGNKREGFVMWQTSPKPAFFKILKTYYPNGYLKKKGKCMGGGYTMVGVWEYYDESGQLTSKVDEDEKFGKFDYNELLLFLHQKDHLNIETGENRENVSFNYDKNIKQWWVEATSSTFWITEYIIDGETGVIIDKKEYQGGII
jgi:hypothetical protein